MVEENDIFGRFACLEVPGGRGRRCLGAVLFYSHDLDIPLCHSHLIPGRGHSGTVGHVPEVSCSKFVSSHFRFFIVSFEL